MPQTTGEGGRSLDVIDLEWTLGKAFAPTFLHRIQLLTQAKLKLNYVTD